MSEARSIPCSGQFAVDTTEDERGFLALRIHSPWATVVYDCDGGGIASLIDLSGHDWVGYSTEPEAAGEYRGIPNIAEPAFHPGHTGCSTEIVRLDTHGCAWQSRKEGWVCSWELNATALILRVRTPEKQPYWILYEGIPGGRFESNDPVVRCDGWSGTLIDAWQINQHGTRWVAFGSASAQRSLSIRLVAGESVPDIYWPMQRSMTVCGFGRSGRKSETRSHLSVLQTTVEFRFVESTDPIAIANAMAGGLQRLEDEALSN